MSQREAKRPPWNRKVLPLPQNGPEHRRTDVWRTGVLVTSKAGNRRPRRVQPLPETIRVGERRSKANVLIIAM
jgi:hypothetical protein